MNKLVKYISLSLLFATLLSFTIHGDLAKKPYKVLVQMKNYSGEGAYMVVSVLDAKGNYIKTLQVLGDDKEYYMDMPKWWKFQRKQKGYHNIDAISGETISGGERTTFTIQLDEKWLNRGYKLRFETAVEEVDYHAADVEIPLNTKDLRSKPEGKGFIRYVRLLPL